MKQMKGKKLLIKRNSSKKRIAQIIPRLLLLTGVVVFLKLLLRKRTLELDAADAAAVLV